MTTEYTEYYRCNECGATWAHVWDTADFNNDFTQCPNMCEEFDFDEISSQEYAEASAPLSDAYNSLADRQTSLDPECQQVLYENLWELYEK